MLSSGRKSLFLRSSSVCSGAAGASGHACIRALSTGSSTVQGGLQRRSSENSKLSSDDDQLAKSFPNFSTRRIRQKERGWLPEGFPAATLKTKHEEVGLGLSNYKENDIIRVSKAYNAQSNSDTVSKIHVLSLFVASTIDLVSVLSKVFAGSVTDGGGSSHPVHRFGKTSVTIQLPPSSTSNAADMVLSSISPNVDRYVTIFRYGSVGAYVYFWAEF